MDIGKTFEEANSELAIIDEHVKLIVVGGSAFIIKNLIDRTTFDVDYINKVKDSIKPILEKYNINDKASMYDSNFGDYETDMELHKKYSHLEIYVLSTERLLASRMFNRKRHDDLNESFKDKSNEISQLKFENILEELVKLNQPTYNMEFKENVYLIDELYAERGWDEKDRIKRICEEVT